MGETQDLGRGGIVWRPSQRLAQHRVVTGHPDISIVYREETFPMALRILLSIAAIYMALVGLGFIFAPQAIGIGAVPTDASAALIAYLRLFGSRFLVHVQATCC